MTFTIPTILDDTSTGDNEVVKTRPRTIASMSVMGVYCLAVMATTLILLTVTKRQRRALCLSLNLLQILQTIGNIATAVIAFIQLAGLSRFPNSLDSMDTLPWPGRVDHCLCLPSSRVKATVIFNGQNYAQRQSHPCRHHHHF